MISFLKKISCLGFALIVLNCSAGSTPNDIIYGADDTVQETTDGISGNLPIGSVLKTNANVNFRTGPSTSYSVMRVLPTGTQVITVNQTSPSGRFYNVSQQGTVGWVHGAYLDIVSTQVNDAAPVSGDRADIIARAQSSVGYSYYWGHASWRNDGTDLGSCSGSCPSCSHSGNYGADCSGMVAKAWQVPASNNDITVDDHPYSTADFVNDTSQWSTVSRDSLQSGDALVYHSGSDGHVVIYESGDGWGTQWVYECKGCAPGCVHDLRSFSSVYHGIKKAGL